MTEFAFDIPTLDAGDVALRAIQESDLEPMAAFYATERSQFVGGPLPRVEAWRMISSNLGHWALRGYGMWVIEAEARPIGMCGFIFREGWASRNSAGRSGAALRDAGLPIRPSLRRGRMVHSPTGWTA